MRKTDEIQRARNVAITRLKDSDLLALYSTMCAVFITTKYSGNKNALLAEIFAYRHEILKRMGVNQYKRLTTL